MSDNRGDTMGSMIDNARVVADALGTTYEEWCKQCGPDPQEEGSGYLVPDWVQLALFKDYALSEFLRRGWIQYPRMDYGKGNNLFMFCEAYFVQYDGENYKWHGYADTLPAAILASLAAPHACRGSRTLNPPPNP